MPYNDTPDWGGLYNNAVVFPLFDQAELAARLGSVMVYDRRGALLWYDDFTFGLSSVETLVTGTNAAATLSATGCFRGPFCVRMHCGSEILAHAKLYKAIPLPTLSAYGFAVTATIGTGVDRVYVYLNHDDGTTMYQAVVLVDLTGNVIQIEVPGGWQTIATGLGFLPRGNYYQFIKLVIDPVSHKYIRLMLNNVAYNISSYAIYESVSSGTPYLSVEVDFYNWTGGAGGFSYVDNLIVTYAEPES